MSVGELGQELIRLQRGIAQSEVAKVERMFADGTVDAVEGSYASVRIGDPSSAPIPGFYVDPSLAVVSGDHVLVYRHGGYQLILAVLNRNAVTVADSVLRWPWVDASDYAVGDGVTDDTIALAAAIAAAPAGATLLMPPGFVALISSALTIDKTLTIWGYGAELRQATNAAHGVVVAADDVSIRGLKITGSQFAVSTIARGISAVGTSATPLANLTIRDCDINTWGRYGVYLEHVVGFDITRNKVRNIFYGAIMCLSAREGTVTRNRVRDVTGSISSTAYGIQFTRPTSASLVDAPLSEDIVCAENVVRNVTVWAGLGTHSGRAITFANNVVRACYIGVDVVGSSDLYAPHDITITGNVIDSENTAGTSYVGIVVAGAPGSPPAGNPIELASGVTISGNTIRRHGDTTNSLQGAIYCHTTRGVTITGNQIIEPGPHGINLYHTNFGVNVTGNTIVDPWSDSYVQPGGIMLRSTHNTGYIGGNTFVRAAKSAAYVLVRGVSFEQTTDTNTEIELGPNYNEGTTRYAIGRAQMNLPAGIGAFGTYANTVLKRLLHGTVTWNPPSVADGDIVTTTITVTGAVVGNQVAVGHNTITTAGIILTGIVSAADTVTVTLLNKSGATYDAGSGTLRVTVFSFV
jgi:hypothetical protein